MFKRYRYKIYGILIGIFWFLGWFGYKTWLDRKASKVSERVTSTPAEPLPPFAHPFPPPATPVSTKGREIEIKIIEGWDVRDIARALHERGADDDAFLKEAMTPSEVWANRLEYGSLVTGLPQGATLEGYLFPNTYRVWRNDAPQSLIKKQLDEFRRRFPRLADEARAQGRVPYQVVTLASIVEKEVSDSDDRKIVAGIFLNRLKEGMMLQSDATVNYLTSSGRARSTTKDLEVDSPYNTYKHKGLPPGPICNPSEESIRAALYPATTPYLFFLADPQGRAYYATTFEGHKQNRVRAFAQR